RQTRTPVRRCAPCPRWRLRGSWILRGSGWRDAWPRVSARTDHLAAGGQFRLRRCDRPDHAKAVARAFHVELHAGCALPVHHTDHELLLELVVDGAHAAALPLEIDAGFFQRPG